MEEYTVGVVRAFDDNYSFVVHGDHEAMVIDPGDASPIISYVKERNLALKSALLTHHHSDHCAGAVPLQKLFGIGIYGPRRSIRGITDVVKDNQDIPFNTLTIRVLSAPGHTMTHCVYYCETIHAVFTGDTLFNVGCGRMFEGTPKDFYRSLQRIASLPGDTLIYCGHEYTLENIQFALTVDPDNIRLKEYAVEMEKTVACGKPTVPTPLSVQKEINPFLRCSEPAIRASLGMKNALPHEVFAQLRKRKDNF